jgi:hypothetical protein
MAYSFDGPARVITITAQTAMDVRDLYSRWADWVNTGDNSKYLPAFSTVGGEAIDATAGTSIPIYAFMQNGWKIRPQESNHTLNVAGGVLLGPGGGDPFINPIGAFTIRISYSQPVQAITVATGGGGGGVTAAGIWSHPIEGVITAEEIVRVLAAALAGKISGAGTNTETVRSLTDSKDRVVYTVDASGNRSSVALDVT